MYTLQTSDPKVFDLIEKEKLRQKEGLELIPSENYVSSAVLEALGSIFTNKYSEGYPGKRYYGGNANVDNVERLAQERARMLFGVPHVNVQPYSGSPANLAIYFATCKPGDPIMGHNLPDGGHLTHGWKVSITGTYYQSIPYHVRPDGYLDFDEIWHLAREHKPRLIWCGATAYPREFPFEEFGKVADEVGALFVADIAHIAGLIIAGVHKSPVPYAHIVTTTTHKTLRGPRGGMIMVTQKGLDKDPELAESIDRAVFPGLQGGPHDHTTAAIAVALEEAMRPSFKEYGRQVVVNNKSLAETMIQNGLKLVTDGTDNHMSLIDLTSFGIGTGIFVQNALETAGITVNKNTIPGEPSSPFYPSGIRLGTPAVTSRGMKEQDMEIIGKWIAKVIREFAATELPQDKTERSRTVKEFTAKLDAHPLVVEIRAAVKEFASRFPVPGVDA